LFLCAGVSVSVVTVILAGKSKGVAVVEFMDAACAAVEFIKISGQPPYLLDSLNWLAWLYVCSQASPRVWLWWSSWMLRARDAARQSSQGE
jgi:hypothetical protein